ncbi:PilN domain-containing protein [Candidatus Microgenomates bacterium]|nr:PilN domain-containing protein [Candidatus Microgenomates bacterium]
MLDIDISKISNAVGEPTAHFVESEKDREDRLKIAVFSAVFTGIFLIGTLLVFILGSLASARAKTLADSVADLKTANQELLDVEKEASIIERRNKNALTSVNSVPMWSVVFEEISKINPKNVTFNRFEADSVSSVRISGTSENYENLAKLIVSLEQSDFFTNVVLSSSAMILGEGRAKVEFSLSSGITKDFSKGTLAKEGQKIIVPPQATENNIQSPGENTPADINPPASENPGELPSL